MKKTIFSLILKPNTSLHKLLYVVLLAFPITLFGQSQIKYIPTEAILVIQSLNDKNPVSQTQAHELGNVHSGHSTATTVNASSPEQRLSFLRSQYYNAVLTELKIEAAGNHNNTIPGTIAALQRVYNRLLPSAQGERYTHINTINTQLIQRLSK